MRCVTPAASAAARGIASAILAAILAIISTGAAPTPVLAAGMSVSVVGNQLVDSSGNTIRLLGVNHSGSEFMCIQSGTPGNLGWGIIDGPTNLASAQAITSWHADAVRIPLNEDCWLGINGVNPAYGGINYQNAIKSYVQTLHAAGLYTILDLHWSSPGSIPATTQQPMADQDHSPAFWTSVASAFKSDPATAFDLFNEPFIYSSYLVDPTQDPWNCWLNGCAFKQYVSGGSTYTTPYTWQSAGMQSLIDAVRATGARNVVMAGGLGWAGDMSGWLAHRPVDPAGQLAASWHSYPCSNCGNTLASWNAVIAPLAQQVPVIIGETGDSVTSAPTFDEQLLPWADAHGVSYLGWTWNTWANPQFVLITDYSGTPTSNYGTYFKSHLLSLPYSPPVSSPPSTLSPAGQFHALVPTRILDTRPASQIGAFNTPLGPAMTRVVSISDPPSIPSSGVLAVVMNVTVTDANASSYLTLWPSGSAQPMASNLNWSVGDTVANQATVQVGANGALSMYNNRGTADVVIDVSGYFTDPGSGSAGDYVPVAPARVIDTRPATQVGPYSTPLGPGAVDAVQITGAAGVPAAGVSAVVLNLTATDTSESSFLTAWPDGVARPLASNLNWGAGSTVANSVTLALGQAGRIDLYNLAGDADLVVDVSGYYTDGSLAPSALFHALFPTRALDTRPATQMGPYSSPLAAGQQLGVSLAGRFGIPSMAASVPPVAVVLNVTATDTNFPDFLSVYPASSGVPPLISNLNWAAGQTVADMVVVQLAADGTVELYSPRGQVDVVADVLGWYG